jgi:hypothetical protein
LSLSCLGVPMPAYSSVLSTSYCTPPTYIFNLNPPNLSTDTGLSFYGFKIYSFCCSGVE